MTSVQSQIFLATKPQNGLVLHADCGSWFKTSKLTLFSLILKQFFEILLRKRVNLCSMNDKFNPFTCKTD